MKFLFRFLLLICLSLPFTTTFSNAQVGDNDGGTGDSTVSTPPTPGELKEAIDGMSDRITLVENDVSALKKLKISGYIQAEWQHFDQKSNLGGGAFYNNSLKNLFLIRRGRIKFKYSTDDMDYVIYPDITERGVVIKEAYMEYRMLPNELLTMDVGLFNRPNYEVEYSSSNREAIERSQVVLAFYPGERDLGLMFTLKKNLFEGFTPKLQLGIFNGPGTTTETDSYKDIIGRLTFGLPLGDDSPVQIDLGASYYFGGTPQTTDTIMKVTGDTLFTKVADPIDGSNMKGMGNKSNFNIESQIYLDVLPFGGTIIKGEFLTGERAVPGAAATASSVVVTKDTSGKEIPTVKAGTAATLLKRVNQMGYYAYFIQNIGTDLQLAVRYDFFDRNTNLAGTKVKSSGDAASSILGFGINYFVDKMRIGVWYEMPTFAADENLQNDSSGKINDALRSTDVKDNKTTIRFQYKF